MAEQQSNNPIVKSGEHILHTTAASLAEMFGKPVADAAEIQRKQESQLRAFYDALVNTPGHLTDLLKRLTPAQRDKPGMPTIMQDGKKRVVPQVVAELVNKGYTPFTAENLFSNMMRMRQAYVDYGYIPQAGTPWKDAYAEATKLLSVKRREKKASAVTDALEAKRAGYIANEVRKLSKEERNDPAKVGEATLRGLEAFDDAQERGKIASAGIEAIQAIGGEEQIPALIDYLNDRLAEWQTKHSAKEVAPMEVPALEENAEQPARAVNQ